MNYYAFAAVSDLDPRDFVTSTTRLLDTGAEFAKFGKLTSKTDLPIWMAYQAEFAELIDCKLKLVRLFSCTDLAS